MAGFRLADLDMKQPAEDHFQRAVQLVPNSSSGVPGINSVKNREAD
jgi:hypothetical protein